MKIVVLGDSISEGIGSQKMNYIYKLGELSHARIINNARTGTMIDYGVSLIKKVLKETPDYAIIMYGSVDAQIRPNLDKPGSKLKKIIPKRYLGKGMLDERAFYSKKIYRIIPDRIDNIIRKVLKKLVVLISGTTQWKDIETFEKEYTYLIQCLVEKKINCILVSTMYIDDKLFLNSSTEYMKYNTIIKKISKNYGCAYLDLFNLQKANVLKKGWDELYSKDHFHPNKYGYDYIATELFKVLKGK